LENLDYFREEYGFVAADDVLRAVSLMVSNSARDVGNSDDFVGHINTTQIVVITTPNHLRELEEKIRSRLVQSLDYFYPLRDRESTSTTKKRLHIQIGQLESSSKSRSFSNLNQLMETLVNQLS